MNYYDRARSLATRNTEPTMTDQSAAHETDINVIIPRFLKTGTVPATAAQPMYEDFSNMPNDLLGFIELARSIDEHRQQLPEALRELPIDELTALTAAQINAIINPPDANKPANTEETAK